MPGTATRVRRQGGQRVRADDRRQATAPRGGGPAHLQNYADAKNAVVDEIMARADAGEQGGDGAPG